MNANTIGMLIIMIIYLGAMVLICHIQCSFFCFYYMDIPPFHTGIILPHLPFLSFLLHFVAQYL